MADLAELAVRVTSTGIETVKGQLASLGSTGEAAAQRLGGAAKAYESMTARAQDFARAGASASQIQQMTGASAERAAQAVKQYAGTVAQATIDVDGLKAAQAQLALAGMRAGETFGDACAKIEHGGHGAAGGIRQLDRAFGMMTAQAVGANHQLGAVGGILAGMSGGGAVLTGVIAGVAALAYGYTYLTEATRKAKEEQDNLTESLRKWYQTKREGEAGERTREAGATLGLIQDNQQELATYQRALDIANASRGHSPIPGMSVADLKSRVAELKAAIADETRIYRAGVEDIQRLNHEREDNDRQSYASSLAGRLSANQHDTQARQQAITELAADQATLQKLVALPESSENSARIAAYASTIRELQNALKPTAAARSAATAAARADDAEARALARVNAERERAAALAAASRATIATQLQDALAYNDALRAGADAVERYNDALAVRNAIAKDGAGLDAVGLSILAAEVLALQQAKRETQSLEAAQRAAAQSSRVVADETSTTFRTLAKEMQHDLAGFFEGVMTKGVRSFRDLFSEIQRMFVRMLAEMEAEAAMRKITGAVASMLGSTGSGGGGGIAHGLGNGLGNAAGSAMGSALGSGAGFMGLSNGGILAATAQTLAIPAIPGAIAGSLIGAHTTSSSTGALGGAAAGAAAGAAIGSVVPIVGTAIGAIVGGAAGLVTGFFGARHSAKALAAAQEQARLATLNNEATLASWRASLSQSAADQKRAAELEIQVKYESIRKQINDNLKGKKNEAERNRELAEAQDLYRRALKQARSGIEAFTGALNEVMGYKPALNALIYGASGGQSPGGGGSGGGTGGRDGGTGQTGTGGAFYDRRGTGDLVVPVMIDGKVIAQAVLKNFQRAAQRSSGNTANWAAIQAVS